MNSHLKEYWFDKANNVAMIILMIISMPSDHA